MKKLTLIMPHNSFSEHMVKKTSLMKKMLQNVKSVVFRSNCFT